jgi:hypothetical protein
VDLSSIKGESYGRFNIWAFAVGDHSSDCWRICLKERINWRLGYLIKELKNQHIYVSCLWLDDALENIVLPIPFKQQDLGGKIRIKWTSKATNNGKFHAIFNYSGIEGESRNGFCAECVSMLTFMRTCLLAIKNGKGPIEIDVQGIPKMQE